MFASVAVGIPSPTAALHITASAAAAAAVIPATGGDSSFLSAVLVSAAVVPSVYLIWYLLTAVVNGTTVPSHTPCPTVCFATVRPM